MRGAESLNFLFSCYKDTPRIMSIYYIPDTDLDTGAAKYSTAHLSLYGTQRLLGKTNLYISIIQPNKCHHRSRKRMLQKAQNMKLEE